MPVSKHDRQDAMWGTLLTAFSDTSLLEFGSLMGVVGIFARTCGCGFFMRFSGADLCVRIWVRFFFRGFWGADCFADFVMACADFGVRIFGCFPAEKTLKSPIKKPHQKNPHQRSSPRNFSSQYATTLLLPKHNRSPQGVWVQMHLVENHSLCADGFCQGG